jgi:Fe2+ transport system protein FeoA
MKLNEIKVGEEKVVNSINAEAVKYMRMGLVPGTMIKCESKLGNLIELKFFGVRMVICNESAKHIMVV